MLSHIASGEARIWYLSISSPALYHLAPGIVLFFFFIVMRHFIRENTVCQSTSFGVSGLQKVNYQAAWKNLSIKTGKFLCLLMGISLTDWEISLSTMGISLTDWKISLSYYGNLTD